MTIFKLTCKNERNVTTLNMVLFQVEKTTEVNQNVLTPFGHQQMASLASTLLLLTSV